MSESFSWEAKANSSRSSFPSLGVIIDDGLRFKHRCDYMLEKMAKNISFFKLGQVILVNRSTSL